MTNKDNTKAFKYTIATIVGMWLAYGLGALAFFCTVGYIVLHFIAKFW